MNKFLKSVRSNTNNRDDLIKKSIINQLSQNIKEIHYCAVEENKSGGVSDISEVANSLCTTVEAMFLHGLKASLTYHFRRVISDLDERPEPNFWTPLLVISHRQIIDQVSGMSQITSEVGQCRAWIRLVLNDCLLSSYLMTLRNNSSVLKSFYKTTALVRDCELLDVAQRLVEGIEVFNIITLPCNSSLLNTWSLPPLILAGIWVPALKASLVAPCDDVAQCLDESTKSHLTVDTGSDNISLSSAMSINSHTSSLRQVVALSEDEILKIILANPANKNVTAMKTHDDRTSSPESSAAETKTSKENIKSHSVGNQLNHGGGWSFDESQISQQEIAGPDVAVTVDEIEPVENVSNVSDQPPGDDDKPHDDEGKIPDPSFTALIESYNMLSGGYIKTPDIKEVWHKFNSDLDQIPGRPGHNNNENSKVVDVNVETAEHMSQYIGTICREQGFDAQNFNCAECRSEFTVNARPQVCAFTGRYFCDACMCNERVPIPARIIHNWDFKMYPVSRRAFEYIDKTKDDPIIDFKALNPFIYGAVEQMAILQSLRNQLNFLRAYLYTCREPVIEELQKQMSPREYMYEHIHQYSISDLYNIESNDLAHQLEKVIVFGKEHVKECWLCSQKGFFCEICNKPKALFPFDVDHVYRCEACNAVYHKSCFFSIKNCRKCDRKKKREELPVSATDN